jgi:hypothetical protein
MDASIAQPRLVGREINAPKPIYFDQVVLDNLLEAFLELSAELWTCRDRQFALERVLSQQGQDIARLIEDYQPSEEEMGARKAMRDALVARLFDSFLRRPVEDR